MDKLSLFFHAYFCSLPDHEIYMQRCLELALEGAGYVAPNPMVGAVLVYGGRVIGEGWHRHYGAAHAEVNCINSVAETDKGLISKSTLYVSLEPCAHFGKTPPCTNLIIENNIPEVVIGCKDSFREVNGRGIEKLTEKGIHVIIGVLEKEAIALNKRFFTFHERRWPYIILKWAQSDDEKIAGTNGERIFISNDHTNRLVHRWRSEEAAIMVGTRTAIQDDPALTTRLWPGNDPVRLLLDLELKLPSSLQLFNGGVKTIVFNQLKQAEEGMLSFYKIEKDEPVIPQVLKALYDLQLQSLLVEGGAALLQSFIDAKAWDEARVICNKALTIGNGMNAPVLSGHHLVQTEQLQTDRINIYLPTS